MRPLRSALLAATVATALTGALAVGVLPAAATTNANTNTNANATPPAAFELVGSGWGHGVGLSQYGAQAMAREGRSTAQILAHYYRGTTLGRNPSGRALDVNVRYQPTSFSLSHRALAAGSQLTVCAMQGTRCARSRSVIDRTADAATVGRVVLSRTANGVRATVTNAKGRTHQLEAPRIRVRWTGTRLKKGAASVIRLDTGREYRHGQLMVTPYGNASLNANLRVRLQGEYLRGVAEMPSSWEPAALQAQAIIARTYALRGAATRKSDCGCHMRDSVVNQVYAGWSKESEGANASFGKRWVAAVTATKGQVVQYDGGLAETYYYSSSGGSTLNSEDVWSATVPYLRATTDPWSTTAANPNRRWTHRISQASASQLFGLAKVLRIEITGRHQGGGIAELTAYGPKNTKRISGKADTLRIRLGLKSAWVNDITAVR